MSEYKEDARVPYVSREDFPTDQIGIYNHILETRKLEYIPELFARMASSPGAMEAVASVGEHVRFDSVLDEVLREMERGKFGNCGFRVGQTRTKRIDGHAPVRSLA